MTLVPLTPQPEWHHLPRLRPEHYQGFAAVLWTITLDPLTDDFWRDFWKFHQQHRDPMPA